MASCGLFPIRQWYATQLPYINIHARVRVRHQLPQSYLFLHSLLHVSFWVFTSGVLIEKKKGQGRKVPSGFQSFLEEICIPAGEELGFRKHEEEANSCEKRSISRKMFGYFGERAVQRVPKESCSEYGGFCCGWLQRIHGQWS